jgi:hydrogenase/urease accessory protein HupE
MLIWCVAFVPSAFAHEVRPAFLELTERGKGEFDVLWKVPALGGAPLAGEEIPHELPATDASATTKAMPCGCPVPAASQLARGVLPIHPRLPADAQTLAPPQVERLAGAELRRWTIRTGANGLEGWEVSVHGLEATMVDVLVRIAFADGRVVSRLLRPDAPTFTFAGTDAGLAASGYFALGVEHILFGLDHLLFVLALILITSFRREPLNRRRRREESHSFSAEEDQRLLTSSPAGVWRQVSEARAWGVWRLAGTMTAFTVAHSITLGLATLGYVNMPAAPVEAVIALSIVFLATEIVRLQEAAASSRRGRQDAAPPSLTERQPWLVAFSFGLLHGFGFAGALSDVGLPANDIPLALLLFNVGVEAGQLLFVAAVLPLAVGLRGVASAPPAWLRPMPVYGIGAVASYWLIARVAALW